MVREVAGGEMPAESRRPMGIEVDVLQQLRNSICFGSLWRSTKGVWRVGETLQLGYLPIFYNCPVLARNIHGQ